MDFNQHVATVQIWISSCTHIEQLRLCKDAVDRFVFQRFKNHVPEKQMQEAQGTLLLKIYDMENKFSHL